jgi:VWFA-related protein
MRAITLSMLVLASLIAPVAQQPAPPAQGPTFRVAVDFVEVDAVVTDRNGKFVRGLTKDDFEVFEDGKPQTVTTLTVVDLPTRRSSVSAIAPAPAMVTPATASVAPDVRTNDGTFDGRVIVLMLDDLLVDARRSLPVRRLAKDFINQFVEDGDLVAVVTSGGAPASSQNFTTNRGLMTAAVDRFIGTRLPSKAMSQADAYARQAGSDDPYAQQRPMRSREALERLTSAAGFLSSIRGRRKTLVWFTEGVDYDVDSPMNFNGPDRDSMSDARMVRDAMSELIGTAQRAGVMFYAVDPRGVGAGLDDAVDIAALPAMTPQSELGMRSVQNEIRWTQGTMRTISDETGGFAILGGNINEHFRRVIDQNSSYYLLGYYPQGGKKNDKFRSLEVKVKKPGLRVQYRKGYTAPQSTNRRASAAAAAKAAPPELQGAVESPLPASGVPMRVFAAPFLGSPKRTALMLVIELEPSGLRFQQQADAFTEGLDLLIVPVDASGRALDGAHDEAPLKLSAETYERVRQGGLRIMRRLDVPPGRYQLHIGAQSTNSKAVGAVTYDLEAPDFTRPALSMSGIALTSDAEGRRPTAPPDKTFTDVLPRGATARREFARDDTLLYFAEIYAKVAGTTQTIQMQASLISAETGTVVFSRTDLRRADEFKGTPGAFGLSASISLVNVPPGAYTLKVEARSTLADVAPAAREVALQVR